MDNTSTNNKVTLDVDVDTSEIDIFISKLKEANSLADELTSKCEKLELNVQI